MSLRILPLALGLGCVGTPSKSTETGTTGDTGRATVPLADVGRACLYGDGGVVPYGDGGTTDFSDGGTTEVEVVLEPCASGCAGDVAATCTAALDGASVVIAATGSYTTPAGSPTCPAVCVPVVAVCPGPSLSAGSFTLSYRGDAALLTVPSTAAPVPCAGELYAR